MVELLVWNFKFIFFFNKVIIGKISLNKCKYQQISATSLKICRVGKAGRHWQSSGNKQAFKMQKK